MSAREMIKGDIDKVGDEYLEILQKLVKVFIKPDAEPSASVKYAKADEEMNWHDFIEEFSGCLADDPITRGEQGEYEIREEMD